MKEKVNKILEKVLIFLMSILVVDVLWQVISRYLNKFIVNNFDFQIPAQLYSFTDELAGFLLVWVALLGGAWATGRKEHLSIELLPEKLNEANKKRLSIIINSLVLLFSFGVLIIGGVWLVYTRFYFGQISAAMEVPIGFVYSIVPISGAIINFYVINDIYIIIKSQKRA